MSDALEGDIGGVPDKRRPPAAGMGRRLGSHNKKTEEAILAVEEIRASGTTPLQEMWAIAQTPQSQLEKMSEAAVKRMIIRFSMLKEIAPYVHPKLAAVMVKTDPNIDPVETHESLLDELDRYPLADDETTLLALAASVDEDDE